MTSLISSSRLQNLIQYLYHDVWEETSDRRANTFTLIGNGGPWRVILIVFIYLLLVLKIVPEYMKNRKPYDLRKAMVTYNSMMVLLNGTGFLYGLKLTNFGAKTWECACRDENDNSWDTFIMIYLGYFYFLSKFLDLIDTFFFVLRKKYNHLTFLHLFHHGMMPFVAWVGFKYFHFNNGFTGLFNSFIHAIMYVYYALSAMGDDYKKYTWWKKYLTQMQMIQFICVLSHALYSTFNPNCCWSKTISIMEGTYASIFLYLFGSFYLKSYRASRKQQQQIVNTEKLASKSKTN